MAETTRLRVLGSCDAIDSVSPSQECASAMSSRGFRNRLIRPSKGTLVSFLGFRLNDVKVPQRKERFPVLREAQPISRSLKFVYMVREVLRYKIANGNRCFSRARLRGRAARGQTKWDITLPGWFRARRSLLIPVDCASKGKYPLVLRIKNRS